MAKDSFDKSITELKASLFDTFTKKLSESDNHKANRLCGNMIDAKEHIHTLVGIVAEMEAAECGRETYVCKDNNRQ